ncbi:GDP-D-mannose dehydratase [Methanothermobacter thermautotrophicus str. Delta H]|uniref:GDP-mannose 4,6-dehydratase n=1 Tax=Methanothermobacter thermautotrophicus (strain ATCC 29096 / DSM 1053 / JCM 10044 / NBRC 100330 / Delta H) TaxID=187420 RepID=O26433_METTH|nr:GDP-mannose 4,6-dehydratase [Methanothermobacter thermautotrophicus]AAB84839.1 GDP-D-mannose dehydratase [Methanothermobacter thermautotrophicus str. Delta H]WBF06629.1 GDP-mannose 4,6-dehydratase [Methanothermobacter thermautotrophicus]
MKSALITGITGQDGAYLAKFLLEKGYEVYGIYRRLSTPNFWRLQYLEIFDRINLVPADLTDEFSLLESLKISDADEVYHLAAQSFVGTSFEQPTSTAHVTGVAVTSMLEAIRHYNPHIRFYQASSSEIYGDGHTTILNENSPFKPSSPYAAAKLYGYWMTRIYREGYDIFACNGILFNHESPLRGLEFVTRKISNTAAKIALGLEDELLLGNLDAKRDWGYAPDYVEAMHMMLQHKEPDDFVIATAETHTVREFCEKSFEELGLDWQDYVKVDKRFFRPLDVNYLCGDYSKARENLGWQPKTKFEELVKIMVREDLERWERWQNGEKFPWDASNYPDETKLITRALRS